MTELENEKILASIDIGSSKVVALVARLMSNHEVELIGMGVAPSEGIKSGSVTNIEHTVLAVQKAIEEAETLTGVEIDRVILNITGKHVKGDNSMGVIAITNRDRVVTSHDVYRVIEAAQSIRIPAEYEILHVLSREFKVDDQNGIKDPTGMAGIRLEADVHVVTGHRTHVHNLEKSVEESGVGVSDRVLSSLASSGALLGEGEKELGVAVVDIGAGITDIIVYIDGGVLYTSTICMGASLITHDISIGLKTTLEHAESLKRNYGSSLASRVDPGEVIEVPVVGDRPHRQIQRKELVEIIEARVREMLELIDHEIIKSGKKNLLAGGLVLTGGGALLNDMAYIAEEVIGLSSSIGYPRGLSGIADRVSSPVFSTAVGLLHYGAKYNSFQGRKKNTTTFLLKVKSWLQEHL